MLTRLLRLAPPLLVITLAAACAGNAATPAGTVTAEEAIAPPETSEPGLEASPGSIDEGDVTAPPAPVLARVDLGMRPSTLDPSLVPPLDSAGNDLVENLFIGLTRLDPDSGEVSPWLAREWEVFEEGLIWRVFLRDDVYWVQIDPDTGVMERVRPVTAGDVVFAVERACRPETAAPLLTAVVFIDGCRAINSTPPEAITPELIQQKLGARVLNDGVVEFHLSEPLGFFPSLLAMPVYRPLPRDLVEAAGEGWTAPDQIVTSGPFTLQPGFPIEEGYTLVQNQFWPIEAEGSVAVVQVGFSEEENDGFAAWEAGSLDLAAVPLSRLGDAAFEDDPRFRLLAQPGLTLIAFHYETFPFNNPGVRQAFSLALDRDQLVRELLLPAGAAALPADGFAPPGTAGVPPYGSSGLAFDPDAAREVLAEAGHGNCSGMPEVVLLTDQSALSVALAESLVAMWADVLACDSALFTVEAVPLQEVLITARRGPAILQGPRPALALISWQADYNDTAHWLADLVGCRESFPGAYLDPVRPCIDADEDLSDARHEGDQRVRVAAYESLMAAYFGPKGEMPAIPLYFWGRGVAIREGVEVYPLHAGPLQFDRWTLE